MAMRKHTVHGGAMPVWRAGSAAAMFLAAVSCATLLSLAMFWWAIVPAIAVLEVLVFPALWRAKYYRFNTQRGAPPQHVDPRDVFDRFTKEQAKLSKYICIQKMLQKWFGDIPLADIKRGNVADLLCYGFWYKSPQQLVDEGQRGLPDQLVCELEAAWGVTFEDGYNEGLPFMSHLWQPLRCHYRPMMFYVGIEVIFALKHCLLLATGFRWGTHQGYSYYTSGLRKPARDGRGGGDATPQEQPQTPILFLHGIGLGLLPYITFVWQLAATRQPVIAVESPHLGMRWVARVPPEDDVVDTIVSILDKEGVDRVAVVGHSYGTFMASRLVQRFKSCVQSVTLIDPVCFVMYSGKLILNFVYQPHRKAITTGLVARDIHHAASVCRNFYWSLLNLWPDQLPDKALVVLSGRDELVPVAETIRMLEEESSAHLLYHDHHCHAEFIKDLAWQARVVDRVARLASGSTDTPLGDGADVDHTGEQMLTGLDMEHSILPDDHVQVVRSGSRLRRHARSDSASSYESYARQIAHQAAAESALVAAHSGVAVPGGRALRPRHKRSASSVPLPTSPLVQL